MTDVDVTAVPLDLWQRTIGITLTLQLTDGQGDLRPTRVLR
ncbi:hypothetical protein [Streptomyces sp. uw30]|nr:hypothetical protein [Streptomyces sp. uw30]